MKQVKIFPIGTNVYLEREDLEKMHTKQLIEIKHIISAHEREWNVDVSSDWLKDGWFMYKWDYPYWMFVNAHTLNEVLRTRPHYPSHRENIENIKKLIASNKRKTKRNLKYKK